MRQEEAAILQYHASPTELSHRHLQQLQKQVDETLRSVRCSKPIFESYLFSMIFPCLGNSRILYEINAIEYETLGLVARETWTISSKL